MDSGRLSELFEQAAQMAPEQRAAWLDAACEGDVELRERLERLLRADAKAQAFLENPPTLLAESLDDSTADVRAAPLAFGPYRVVRSIGVGGMGEVWLAERSDGEFEQRVAIKQLAYPTPGLLQRFRQERQILARLEHPNIARLLDGGVDAQGAPYLVMEHIDGVPITEFARTHALDLRARLRLFLHVCEAVQYAHQNLVVHRDLKPSNVFVTEAGVPKLLDFGIAKVLAATDDDAPTQTMARMLTPDYAAPEQFHGGAITTATDVYALGVLLYELLAGARPQRALTDPSIEPAQIVDPPPPSAASTTAAAPPRVLRGDLDRITLKALAADPQRRYPSAEALAADIQRYLDGLPIAARGDSTLYRLRKFAWRHRFALAAASGVIVVSIAAAIVSFHQARIARDQAQRAEAVRRFLVQTFSDVSPDANQAQPITAHQLLDKGEQQMKVGLHGQPALETEIAALLSSLYRNIGDYERAGALLQNAVEKSTDTAIPAEIRARSLIELSYFETDKHAFDSSYEHASRALALAENAGDVGQKEASEARHIMNGILVWRGDSKLAEAPLRETLAADRERYGEIDELTADDWQTLGVALDELSRYKESAVAFEHAVAVWRALHGNMHSAVGRSLNDYGLMLLHSGDLDGAARVLREASQIADTLFGAEYEGSRSTRSNLLRVLEQQGHLEEALPERLRLRDIARKRSTAERPDVLAYAQNLVAVDRRELGQLGEAEADFRETLVIWKKIKGSDDANEYANPLMNLGICLALEGKYVEAESSLRAALAIQAKHDAPSSQWLNVTRAQLGNVLRLQHRAADGRRELEAAAAALQRSSDEANPWFALIDAELSEAQLDDGDAHAAEATGANALAIARRAVPTGNVRLAAPLYSLARAKLALDHAEDAAVLLREALAVRSPPLPAGDPRVLEVEVALVNALDAAKAGAEAATLKQRVTPTLAALATPYAADLSLRLAQGH